MKAEWETCAHPYRRKCKRNHCRFIANTGVSSISLVFHENDVYAYDDTGHAGQEEEAEEVIKKISLTDGTEQTVFPIREQELLLTAAEALAINYILLSGNIQRIRKPRLCHLIIKACLNMICHRRYQKGYRCRCL